MNPDDKEPNPMPSIPLRELIKASEGLPAAFQSAVILLCTKIDKGFASIYFFMRSVNSENKASEERYRSLLSRVEALETREKNQALSEKEAQKDERVEELVKEVKQREITARQDLAQVQLEVRAQEIAEKMVQEAEAAREIREEKDAAKKVIRRERLWRMFWAGVGASVLYGLKLLAQYLGLGES